MDFDLSFKPLSERVRLPFYGTDESAGLDVCAFLPENDAGQLLTAHLSRQELADRLGISRTTLWRRIKALEEGHNLLSDN